VRTRDIERLEELEGMAREVRRALDRRGYQKAPFIEVTIREAKIHSQRMIDWLEEAIWLAKNPL